MNININTTKENFYLQYYTILNYIFKLSRKELAILSYFSYLRANLPKDLTSEELDYKTFNSTNRKEVAKSLGISIPNLNNYIQRLKTKKFLLVSKEPKKKTRVSINPNVYAIRSNNANINFNFIIK